MAEESGEFIEALRIAMQGSQAEIWTALPAVVESFNPSKRTCVVQPTIQMQVQDQYGKKRWETMPLFHDVIVQFPGGGGFVLTFPLAAGDEGIIVFAARCVDAWWERGDVQVQAEMRMHDLSDGFFIPTVRSVPNVEPAISATDVELRAVDPAGPRVTLKPNGNAVIASPGNVTVNAATINLNGVLTINGTPYMEHVHDGVESGGSNTGGVV
jgi:hypothetical protein